MYIHSTPSLTPRTYRSYQFSTGVVLCVKSHTVGTHPRNLLPLMITLCAQRFSPVSDIEVAARLSTLTCIARGSCVAVGTVAHEAAAAACGAGATHTRAAGTGAGRGRLRALRPAPPAHTLAHIAARGRHAPTIMTARHGQARLWDQTSPHGVTHKAL